MYQAATRKAVHKTHCSCRPRFHHEALPSVVPSYSCLRKDGYWDFVSNVHQNGPRPDKAGIFGVPSLETATRIDNSDKSPASRRRQAFRPYAGVGAAIRSQSRRVARRVRRGGRGNQRRRGSRVTNDLARRAAPKRLVVLLNEADALAVKQELEKTLAQKDKPTKSPRSERTAMVTA